MKPIVTVIMPSYNTEAFIAEAIESVREQTYKSWQLFIVDDGSTDESMVILNNFANDPRIKVLQTANQGSSGARNLALEQTQTDYVAFLDSDDVWLPNKLEEHLHYMEKNPQVGLSFSGWRRIDEETKTFGLAYLPESRAYCASDFMQGQGIATTSLVVARTKLLRDLGGFSKNVKVVEDIELWYRVLGLKQTQIHGIAKILTHYRTRSGQITRNIKLHHEHWEQLMFKVEQLFPREWKQYEEISKINHYVVLAMLAYFDGSDQEARSYLKQAFAINPTKFIVSYRNHFATAAVLSTLAPAFMQKKMHQILQSFLSGVMRLRE